MDTNKAYQNNKQGEMEVLDGERDGLDRELGSFIFEQIKSAFTGCSRKKKRSKEEEEGK